MKINFNEQYKIRLKESSLSQAKHLVIKSLIVLILKDRYKNKVIVETEKPIGKGIICDIYEELPNEKNKICYEVQKEETKKWYEDTNKKYSRFADIDLVIISVKDLPDDLNKLVKELEKLVF